MTRWRPDPNGVKAINAIKALNAWVAKKNKLKH